MFNINSGRMRHYVEFILESNDTDDWGDPVDSTVVFDTRADVQIKSGQQNADYGTVLTQEIITVLCRYDNRAGNDQKVRWNGKEYEVQHVQPDDRYHGMIVTAESVKR